MFWMCTIKRGNLFMYFSVFVCAALCVLQSSSTSYPKLRATEPTTSEACWTRATFSCRTSCASHQPARRRLLPPTPSPTAPPRIPVIPTMAASPVAANGATREMAITGVAWSVARTCSVRAISRRAWTQRWAQSAEVAEKPDRPLRFQLPSPPSSQPDPARRVSSRTQPEGNRSRCWRRTPCQI